MKIRKFRPTQLFSKKLSKYRKEQREKLEKEVKELEDSLIDQPDQEACKMLEGKNGNYKLVTIILMKELRFVPVPPGTKEEKEMCGILHS